MGRRRKHEEEHENLERWLLTYCDLITLLLAFFVVMYSMSDVDAKKFGSLSIHLRSILNGQIGILKGAPVIAGGAEMGNILQVQPIDLAMVRRAIMAMAEEEGFEESITPTVEERGLVVHIMDTALFERGKADLTPAARSMLDQIAPELRDVPNLLRIEGHTDDTPIRTLLFPSNWELSVARSTTVVRYLIDAHEISPFRVSAMGYGEYRPILPNDTAENKAKNRRIDIVVLSTDGEGSEPPLLESAERSAESFGGIDPPSWIEADAAAYTRLASDGVWSSPVD